MKICPNCQTQNREGTLYCDECGVGLSKVASVATKALGISGTNMLSVSIPGGTANWGTAHLGSTSTLLFRIQANPDPLTVPLKGRPKLTIGRFDPNTGIHPEIDLAPFGAQEKGVSRGHATLQYADSRLSITDMGSVNGTYLNGQRLIANQPRLIRDGDEVRVGRLSMHVYFK